MFNIETLRTALGQATPYFATIMYSATKWRIGTEAPTACTDGRWISFNEKFMEGLKPPEQLFIAAHELWHVVAKHPSQMQYYLHQGLAGYKFNPQLANIAMDAVINKNLKDMQLGRMPEEGVLLTWVTGEESWQDVYRKLLEDGEKSASGEGVPTLGQLGDGASMPEGMDVALPESGGDPDDQPLSDIEMEAVAKKAMKVQKLRGTLPGQLKRIIDDMEDARVDWRTRLRMLITNRGRGDSSTWKKPRKRFLVQHGIYIPSKISTTIPHVAVAVDTSGSVSEQEYIAFVSEIASILSDCTPERLTLIWCDAKVDRVDELTTAAELMSVVKAGSTGGGGTSFDPPFAWLEENNITPTVMVYLTDGYAPEPQDRGFETIWVISSSDGLNPVPFGERIHIDV